MTIDITLDEAEREAIDEAANALDALWKLDVSRGLRDSVGGAEYERLSPAPVLRRLLQRARAKDEQ